MGSGINFEIESTGCAKGLDVIDERKRGAQIAPKFGT